MDSAVRPLEIDEWLRFPWLIHGFSTRDGGVSSVYCPPDYRPTDYRPADYSAADLNLGFTADDARDAVIENRRRFVEALSPAQPLPLATVKQVHGSRVFALREPAALHTPSGLIEADGLTTSLPEVLLAILTADCVPILIADTSKRVVTALHAGWRGTVAGIVEEGIAAMQADHDSHPEDLIAAIGPSIGPCCYTVGEQLQQEFSAAFSYAPKLFHKREGQSYLDLWEANRRQLLSSGLAAQRIATVGLCTACSRDPDGRRLFFSHRAEKGFTGRMMSVVGTTPAGPH